MKFRFILCILFLTSVNHYLHAQSFVINIDGSTANASGTAWTWILANHNADTTAWRPTGNMGTRATHFIGNGIFCITLF